MANNHSGHGGVPPVIEPIQEGGDIFAGTAVTVPHTFQNFGCDRLRTNPETPELTAADREFTLQMFPNGIITFHDGTTLRMFGFEEPDPNNPVDPELQLEFNRPWRPGPMVRVREGDIVHGILKSRHGSHTIHWHGIEPTPFNDGVGHTSFEVTGHYRYQWRAAQAGAYFYHCHVNTPLHFEMGMYGLLIVDPPEGPGRVYKDGPEYDVETFWVADDIDPAWHLLDKEAGLCGGDVGMNVWKPRYFIVNGIEAIPNVAITDPGVAVRCGVNQRVLIRHLNASYSQQDMFIIGPLAPGFQPTDEAIENAPLVQVQQVAVDARPDAGPYAHHEMVNDIYSITAQRTDVIFTPQVAGRYLGVVRFNHWIGYHRVGTALIDIQVGVTNPPSVKLTSPGPAARVSGVVAITAEATDDSGDLTVQFRVDGTNLGGPVTASPFYAAWDTREVQPGSHTLTAVAVDRDGNVTESSPIPVFVFNTIGRSGVIASYSLNESIGTVIYDSTGNGHHGTVGGAAWNANGRMAGALSFDGRSLTSIANSVGLELSQALTIAGWVKPTASGGTQTVLAKDHGKALAYALFAAQGTLRLPSGMVRIGCKDIDVVGRAPLALDTWSHLALTCDGAAVRLFVNGVEVASKPVAGPIETSGGTLHFGGSGVFGEFFKGVLDEVRIYNRALSAAEINEDMTIPV
jgi:hypothetical protein